MSQTKTVKSDYMRIRLNPITYLNHFILWVSGKFGAKSKEVERFMKFAFVGGIGAVVDFSTLFVLQTTLLKPSPPNERLNVLIATTFAFLAAVTSNFIWNRFWTYPDSRSRSVRRQIAQFTFVNAIGWGMRTLWISIMFVPIGRALTPTFIALVTNIQPEYVPTVETSAKVGTFAAQFVALFFVMLWNFFANRYWTYNDVD